jgi:hypothetical protein
MPKILDGRSFGWRKFPLINTQIIHPSIHPWEFHSTHCKMDEYSWDKQTHHTQKKKKKKKGAKIEFE